MGADRAIHIETDLSTDQDLQPRAVAKLFGKMVEKEEPNLVLLGKQSIDTDNNQAGQMLAGLLKWPQGTFASKVEVSDDKKSINVTREVDAGLQTLSMPLPSVVTVDLRLNEPRYATLPNIMKARKKKIETVKAEELGVDLTPSHSFISVEEPAARSGGETVEDVDALIAKLKSQGAL